VLGNLAHAVGIPSLRYQDIVFDSATTKISTGELDMLHERGEQAPEGVLLNERGEPTRDPMDWLKGALLPAGNHRGYGLALVFEILTGILAGGDRFAPNVGGPGSHAAPQGVSLFLMAIDPAATQPYEDFAARVETLHDQIHASPPQPGHEKVYLPGERSSVQEVWRKRTGVPLLAERVDDLRGRGEAVGVRFPPEWHPGA